MPLKTSTSLNRADLVAAYAVGGEDLLRSLADRLGYQCVSPDAQPLSVTVRTGPGLGVDTKFDDDDKVYPADVPSLALWLPTEYRQLAAVVEDDSAKLPGYIHITQPPAPPAFRQLAPWQLIQSRLHQSLRRDHETSAIDEDRLTDRLARREAVWPIPRRRSTRRSDRLVIIADTSPRLIPYRADQELVVCLLRKSPAWHTVITLAGKHPDYLSLQPDIDEYDAEADFVTSDELLAGSDVLILGDLGCFHSAQSGDRHLRNNWREWGQKRQHISNRLMALVPCSPRMVPRSLCSI